MKPLMRKSRLVWGFSLYELMVAVSILSLGLVMIYESFFVIAGTSTLLPDYIKTQLLINEMIWETEDSLRQDRCLPQGEEKGDVVIDKKCFFWHKKIEAIDDTEDLYKVDIALSWKAGGRTIKNSRTAYVRR